MQDWNLSFEMLDTRQQPMVFFAVVDRQRPTFFDRDKKKDQIRDIHLYNDNKVLPTLILSTLLEQKLMEKNGKRHRLAF